MKKIEKEIKNLLYWCDNILYIIEKKINEISLFHL